MPRTATCPRQLVVSFVRQTLGTQQCLCMEVLGLLPTSSMTFWQQSSTVPKKYLGRFLYTLCLQRDSHAAQLFPIVLLNTSKISSDCCIHFLEEVKQLRKLELVFPRIILQMKTTSWKYFLQQNNIIFLTEKSMTQTLRHLDTYKLASL